MELRKFLYRVLVLAIPFVLFSLLIIAVDPYEQYGIMEFYSSEEKKNNTFKHEDQMVFSNALLALNRFEKSNAKNIIFGDSRLSRFPEEYVAKTTGEELFNFGITGGNYHSMFASFWRATEQADLNKVYFQVSYRTFSMQANWPVLEDPLKIQSSWIKYVTDRRVLRSAFDLMGSRKTNAKSTSLDSADWSRKLAIERTLLERHVEDTSLLHEFRSIKAYCDANRIELIFIDFPSHKEVVEMYESGRHSEARLRYLMALSEIAPVYDFCHLNEALAQVREEFRDPLHSTVENNRALIRRIWGRGSAPVRVWKKGKVYR